MERKETRHILEQMSKLGAILLASIVIGSILYFTLVQVIAIAPRLPVSAASGIVIDKGDDVINAVTQAPPRVSSLEERTPLEGYWKIRLGDDRDFARPEYDDSAWDAYRLPGSLMRYIYNIKGFFTTEINGVLWLRRTVHVDRDLSPEDVGLILGRIANADETFFNGVKIGGMGSFPPDEFSMWNHPRNYQVAKSLIRYGGKNVIAIRVWYHTWGEVNGLLAVTGLDDWQRNRTSSNFFIITLDYIIIAMGIPIMLLFFVFYLRRKVSREYLYYTFQLVFGLVIIMELCNYWNPYGNNLVRVKVLIYAWAAINVVHPIFLHRLYELERKKIEITLWILLGGIIFIGMFFTDINWARPNGGLGILALSGIGFYNFSCHYSALYKKRPYSKLFTFFGSTVVIGAIHDGVAYFLKIIGYYPDFGFLFNVMIFPYAACVLYLGTTLLMVSRMTNMIDDIKDLNENLEGKVRHRTVELHVALEEMESMNDQLTKTRDALWGEMMLAKKIQTILLPQKPEIDGFEITAVMLPAENVGGDYYDIIKAGGKSWLVIGDVAGHGVPAGIIMMMVQTSIHTAVIQNPELSPAELLSVINRTITGNIRQLHEDTYITITVFAVLGEGKLNFSGLHQDIMVYRARTGSVEIIETDGILIGLKEDIDAMLGNSKLCLERDDCLLVYTDGITEAWKKGSVRGKRNPDTDMYGEESLRAVFQRNGSRSTEEIKKEILDSMADYDCTDDVTMVIVKRR
ncbi:MAG: SpoIIE family protein phosphatase [Spirochaetes bacterium]|nr:SpoIIE family protein phosphatase [Spirochaetota bacterium]